MTQNFVLFSQQIESVYDQTKNDRKWKFHCKKFPGKISCCQWTSFINGYDKTINFTCPGNTFVAGVEAHFHKDYKDRRYKLKCCQFLNKVKSGGKISQSFINDWHGSLKFTLPTDSVIVGMESQHLNQYEDRQFRIHTCDLVEKMGA